VQSLIAKNQGMISADAIESLYVLFGLDKNESLLSQYFDYWGQLFRGDLGISFTFFPTPVSEVLGDSLPWTIMLVGITTVVSFLLGTGLGVLVGWRRGGWADLVLPVTTFLASIPYF
jgi:peptide/nickel transport system permease protein